MQTVKDLIEYLQTLPEDAPASLIVGADGTTSYHTSISETVTDVIAENIWCREDIATMLEDAGKKSSDMNIDKVLASMPRGLDLLEDRLTEEGWEILHILYDDAIESID